MPEEIWLGYAGSLSASYDLPIVFEAMQEIENSRLRFIVMGDGPIREKFEKDADGLNVTFAGRLPYEQMCGVLCACDIVVNPIVGTSVASIINKHADYAACGKPVLNTQKSDEYRRLIIDYQMGFNCDSSIELAKNLRDLTVDKTALDIMRINARKCGNEKFDRKKTYVHLCEQICN